MREQQDREYQESLEADRQREEEARRAEERALEEQRRLEEEAERLEEEKRQAQESLKQSIEEKRARLDANAPASRAGKATAMLKFHLHDGSRLERLFYAHDTLNTVRDFIDVTFYDREITITNYELATNFPKKIYGPELLDVTLEEAVRRLHL